MEEVAFSAISALTTMENLDEGTRLAYYDIIRGSLNEIAKAALERLMQERGREYISDFAKHYYGQGLEKGREEGLEGLEEMLITLLEARGFKVSKAVREVIENCHDVEQFKTWAKRAVQANAVEEIFPK